MKSRLVLTACLCALMLLAVRPAQARDPITYDIDATHSSIVFKVMHKGVNFVYGRFNEFEGTLGINDRKDPSKIEIDIEVDPKQIDTANKKRDRHLRSDDSFDIKEHKVISFKSTACKEVEENKFELAGDMTLLGQTRPITVIFELTGMADQGPDTKLLGGQTTFTIKRSEFGMDNMLGGIGDDVTIIVSLQAVRKIIPAG